MALKDNVSALKDQPVIGRLIRRLTGDRQPVVPVVRLSGVITASDTPLRSSLALAGVASELEQAFSVSGAKAVALVINSPGGSPVQSALITKRVRALAKEKDLPVFTFIEDVGASGGYMLALAGDEIFADENSIVGSIGVVSAGFGFPEAIAKLGVERRLYTSGESKAMLDPFKPESPDDVARLKDLQNEVHESFKALVRERREGKLAGDEKEMFSGAFWTGARAVGMGLIDGVGDIRTVLRERYGEKVQLKLISGSRPFWRKRAAVTLRHNIAPKTLLNGANLVEDGLAALEARALWSRFGL